MFINLSAIIRQDECMLAMGVMKKKNKQKYVFVRIFAKTAFFKRI
jgi:hypothetical protein